jgi:hypothetical protein
MRQRQVDEVERELRARYGHGYNYGLLPLTAAQGKARTPGGEEHECDMVVYVAPTGESWLVITGGSKALLDCVFRSTEDWLVIDGEFAGGGRFSVSRVHCSSVAVDQGVVGYGKAYSPLRVAYAEAGPEQAMRVRQYLTNLCYTGTEAVRDAADGWSASAITVPLGGRECRLEHVGDYDKRKALLEKGGVRVLPTAVLERREPVVQGGVAGVLAEGAAMTRLAGMATGTDVRAAAYELIDKDGMAVEAAFLPVITLDFCPAYATFSLVGVPNSGVSLTELLTQCTAEYIAKEEPYQLSDFVTYVTLARSSIWLPGSIAHLLLGLECVLTAFLINVKHEAPEGVIKKSITQKLKAFNADYRFVDSRYTGDWLREDIRNPLLHTGVIAVMNSAQLYEAFWELYVLSYLIFLAIVGYDGRFRPKRDSWDTVQVPWA